MHSRGLSAGEQSDIRELVLLGWRPVAHRAGMVLEEFDGGVEIRMADRSKADAVRAILREMDVEAPVAYLGDDQPDEGAFCALRNRGLCVLARPQWKETAASVWLRPSADLLVFLVDWLEACLNAPRPPLLRGYHRDRALSRGEHHGERPVEC